MAVQVRVDLHQTAIRNFLYSPGGPVVRGVRGWAQEVRATAVVKAPKDTGELAGSSSVEMNTLPGLVVGVIRFSAPHAMWVHEGTGVYGPRRRPITARGRVMRFRGRRGGAGRNRGFTYTRSAQGQPGKPFLVTALRVVMVRVRGAHIRENRRR